MITVDYNPNKYPGNNRVHYFSDFSTVILPCPFPTFLWESLARIVGPMQSEIRRIIWLGNMTYKLWLEEMERERARRIDSWKASNDPFLVWDLPPKAGADMQAPLTHPHFHSSNCSGSFLQFCRSLSLSLICISVQEGSESITVNR